MVDFAKKASRDSKYVPPFVGNVKVSELNNKNEKDFTARLCLFARLAIELYGELDVLRIVAWVDYQYRQAENSLQAFMQSKRFISADIVTLLVLTSVLVILHGLPAPAVFR